MIAKRGDALHKLIGWLSPGLRVKRWAALFLLAILFAAGGLLDLLRDLHAPAVLYSPPGQGFERTVFAGLAAIIGTVLAFVAAGRVARAVVGQSTSPRAAELVRAYPEAALANRGPRVVVIGGGTGLSVLLRGLKRYTWNVTAVVAMSDDGGSSGRLRAEWGVPPPGDIRNCLVALADTEPLMERLFQYRLTSGAGLAGHAFGNLFLAAMTEITGDFEEAIRQSSRVLAVRGQVVPCTLERVGLVAEMADGRIVEGESRIPEAQGRIEQIRLVPESPAPVPEVIRALAEADLVVLGPGSLFTSVIPNLLVDGVVEALRSSPACKVYVANLMTQPGETNGMGVAEHLAALLKYAPGVCDVTVVNSQPIPAAEVERYRETGAIPVVPDLAGVRALGVETVTAALLGQDTSVRHNPHALARTLLELVLERRLRRDPRRLLDAYLLREALGRSHETWPEDGPA